MNKCKNCGEVFSDDNIKREYSTYGDIYGLEQGLGNDTPTTIYHCPNCNSIEIEDAKTCEECGEWFLEEELNENDLCKDCRKDEE